MGLCFAMASNGYDLLLVEAQDRLASNDLEGELRPDGRGGRCAMRCSGDMQRRYGDMPRGRKNAI